MLTCANPGCYNRIDTIPDYLKNACEWLCADCSSVPAKPKTYSEFVPAKRTVRLLDSRTSKICPKCGGNPQPIGNFGCWNGKTDSYCKPCKNKSNRERIGILRRGAYAESVTGE